MTGISNSSSAGDYGIQIFTAAGEVAVDSRRFLTATTTGEKEQKIGHQQADVNLDDL